jgi:hypothetical protein
MIYKDFLTESRINYLLEGDLTLIKVKEITQIFHFVDD